MVQTQAVVRQERAGSAAVPDPRWKDLYRLGGIVCYVLLVLLMAGVAAFFIWPYQPGSASTEAILAMLQQDVLGGLFSLDLFMLVTVPVTLILYLAIYVATKEVNESYALIAFVLVLVAVPLLMTTKPLAELVFLSGRYAAAADEAARIQYLGAGEALIALSNGTAWMAFSILSNISTLISTVLMLRSRFFGRTTAILGIVLAISGGAIVLPVIGPLLGLVGTIASPVWLVLLARDFFRMHRQSAAFPDEHEGRFKIE